MPRLLSLHIQNFRGIKDLMCDFSGSDMCCLIGHCDSGKSTILQAISYLFASNWTIPVSDEDFYRLDTSSSIQITGIVEDPPKDLLTMDKYGLDAFWQDEDNQQGLSIELTLTVESDLNPRWEIHNRNNDEYHPISNKDRSLFNIRMIDDYFDTQFNMSKYSLLKSLVADIEGSATFDNKIGIELIRGLKQQLSIGEDISQKVSDKLNEQVASLGGEQHNYSLAVPTAELMLRGNQIGLHAEDVPVRLMGKGSRRQLSLGLQLALGSSESSIILIDEIEQGLEPYKVKTIVRTLKDSGRQVFLTTHSENVLCELDAADLYLLRKGASSVYHMNDTYQGMLRTNPDAFFFDKVIVCEGKTEYGFIIELDRYLSKQIGTSISSYAVSPIIGEGSKMPQYCKLLKEIGTQCMCFIDNDVEKTKKEIEGLAEICCCEPGNAIEEQYFKDAPFHVIEGLINDLKVQGVIPQDIILSEQTRTEVGSQVKKGKWFKNIGGGRLLGERLFSSLSDISKETCMYKQIQNISSWIKGETK